VPYIAITVPSGTVIGRTIDAKIGAAPALLPARGGKTP
jgi:hypothetical protein